MWFQERVQKGEGITLDTMEKGEVELKGEQVFERQRLVMSHWDGTVGNGIFMFISVV